MSTRAIAWDDKPEYLRSVAQHLKGEGVELTVHPREAEFWAAYNAGAWDFVLLDVMEEGSKSEDGSGLTEGAEGRRGPELARRILERTPHPPVFLVTGHHLVLDPQGLGLSEEVPVWSKSQVPAWMARFLVRELKSRGILRDRRKISLIRGEDARSTALAAALDQQLSQVSLQLTRPAGADPVPAFRDASAVVALICPVERVVDPEVWALCGIVRGVHTNLDRLTLIVWGEAEAVTLPPSLAGVTVITHHPGDPVATANHLQDRLESLKVQFFG